VWREGRRPEPGESRVEAGRAAGPPIETFRSPAPGMVAARVCCAALALSLGGTGCTAFKRFAYEGLGRDRWQQPEEVIRALDIRAGWHVADLGAGGGYFTFRLADAVGRGGRVYAVDVDSGMVGYLERRASKEGYGNVDAILAEPDDAKLPEGSVDLLFTCNTYHHLPDRSAYFARLRRALRPHGRVAIIEYAGKSWRARLFGHWTPPETIRREMGAAGLRLEREHDFLPRQSFLVFTVAPGEPRP
jgi:arsenite methyltransferase